MRAEEMEHERLLKELEINASLQEKLLEINSEDNSIELDKLRLQEEKIRGDLKSKEKQLTETERHNRATESISRKSKVNSNN